MGRRRGLEEARGEAHPVPVDPGRHTPSQPHSQRCIRREGTSVVAPEAVTQAVGGGCHSGCGRLLSGINATHAGACRQGDNGWA